MELRVQITVDAAGLGRVLLNNHEVPELVAFSITSEAGSSPELTLVLAPTSIEIDAGVVPESVHFARRQIIQVLTEGDLT